MGLYENPRAHVLRKGPFFSQRLIKSHCSSG